MSRESLAIRRELDVATAVAQMMQLGMLPSKKKIIEMVGGSFSSPWLHVSFEKLKALTAGFKDSTPIFENFAIEKPKVTVNKIQAENLALKDKLKDLEDYLNSIEENNAALIYQNQRLETENNKFNSLIENMQIDREMLIANIRDDKDAQIKMLLNELAQTYKEHKNQLSTQGQNYDETNMQLKVEMVNLKEQLKAKDKKIAALESKVIPQQKRIKQLSTENERLITQIFKLKDQEMEIKE